MPLYLEPRSRRVTSLPPAPAAGSSLAAPCCFSNAAQLAAAVANEAPLAWVALAGNATAKMWARTGGPLAGLVPAPEVLQALLDTPEAIEIFPEQPASNFPAVRK